MVEPNSLPLRISRALRRARFGILSVALTYVLSAVVGFAMAQGGNRFALEHGDKIVSQARASSPILKALGSGRPLVAAALDGTANFLSGVASTLAGYWAPAVYPIAVYRGWVGGIVGVDDNHRSRLADSAERTYYLLVLFLQLLPYSLAGGVGVNLGLARVRPVGDYAGPRLLGLPKEALRDAGRIYLLIAPLFALASAFEFLARH